MTKTPKHVLADLAAEAIKRGHPIRTLPPLTADERLDRELARQFADDKKARSVSWLFKPR